MSEVDPSQQGVSTNPTPANTPAHSTASADKPPAESPSRFAEVLAEELLQVRYRRGEATPGKAPNESGRPNSFQDEVKRERAQQKEAWNAGLIGLAFSGGGIRSATFNLGVLQALADLRLLKYFDYLSTVSGGGYIGSWLAAWIYREGSVENVEKQLRPNRCGQAKAKRFLVTDNSEQKIDQHLPLDEEPEPIYHLRSYSNYLTPQLGLLSADSWVLFSIYLRNFLLNLLVLLPGVMGVMLLVRWLVLAFDPQHNLHWQDESWTLLGWLGIALSVLVSACTGIFLWQIWHSGREERAGGAPRRAPIWLQRILLYWRPTPAWLHVVILIPMLLIATLIALMLCRDDISIDPWQWRWLQATFGLPLTPLDARFDPPGFAEACWFAGLVALAQAIAYFVPFVMECLSSTSTVIIALWRWLCGILTGFIAGLLIVMALSLILARLHIVSEQSLHDLAQALLNDQDVTIQLSGFDLLIDIPQILKDNAARTAALVAWGPPLLLLVFVLKMILEVGLQGIWLAEDLREWWASLAGWVLVYAAFWASVAGVSLYGGWFLDRLGVWFQSEQSGIWVRALLASGWLGTSIAGVLAGKSASTGSGRRNRGLEALTLVAPHVFVLGLLVLVSWFLHILLAVDQDPQDYWLSMIAVRWQPLLAWTAGCLACTLLAAWCVDVNTFSLHGLYGNRLVRCYLGASRPKLQQTRPHVCGVKTSPRQANSITGFDLADDLLLRELCLLPPPSPTRATPPYPGPYLLINTALNLVHGKELAWQERKAESFVLTPCYCGGQSTGYRPLPGFAADLRLGTAVTISGAAASPNMGYHSSPAVTALLTAFNVRLGAWLGNPAHKRTWRLSGPRFGWLYLWRELFGRTDATSPYVYLSDGGHFDNLGVYELVRRRCYFIVVCDAGADPAYEFGDLGELIRKVRSDFGIRIEIDVSSLRPQAGMAGSSWHCALGKIHYADVDTRTGVGTLLYLKPSLTGDEPPDVRTYADQHPSFPHQTTVDQFFSESQFESYRALGMHLAQRVFGEIEDQPKPGDGQPERKPAVEDQSKPGDGQPEQKPAFVDAYIERMIEKLRERWYPPPPDVSEVFLQATAQFIDIHEMLRDDPHLRRLSADIYRAHGLGEEDITQLHAVCRMLQVMENVWVGLKLDDHFDYPLYSGWREVFQRWTTAPTFQEYLKILEKEFSPAFVRFLKRKFLDSKKRPPA